MDMMPEVAITVTKHRIGESLMNLPKGISSYDVCNALIDITSSNLLSIKQRDFEAFELLKNNFLKSLDMISMTNKNRTEVE